MVKEEFSPQFNIRQITWEEPEYLPEVRADRISLLRALRNLVDNSLKYGGDELNEITIGYKDSPDFHTLFVQDNGVGLKKEPSKNVFGWFTRFETSKGIEGTGLGLSIVKEIAERHGGTVWMEPGSIRGITFYLSILKNL
jgi:light-regulated signal transduction histidine kinase (bacteriophytochrome)